MSEVSKKKKHLQKILIELRQFLEIMTLNSAKDTQNDKNLRNKNNA